MDLAITIFIGVISGVITYAVIGVTISIIRGIIIPWFQSEIYKGHNIEGEWYGYDASVEEGTYNQIGDAVSTIFLKQRGNKISGELLLTTQPSGKKCRKLFELEGSFVETILVLTKKVKDSNSMGTGTVIMKLTEGGDKLKGKDTYISAHDWATVFAHDQVWIRKV